MIDLNAVGLSQAPATIETAPAPRVLLDLGCGQNPREGFTPVDAVPIPGLNNIVHDLLSFPYPWDDSSVDEVHLSHVLEHFTKPDRVKILNELYRILKPGGNACIITPCGERHAQDPTHKDAEVVAGFYLYFNKNWRETNKLTHNEYEAFVANFDPRIDYSLNPEIANRNDEFKRFALQFYKGAVLDMYVNLTAVK